MVKSKGSQVQPKSESNEVLKNEDVTSKKGKSIHFNIKKDTVKKVLIVVGVIVVAIPLLDFLIQISILNRYAAFVGNSQVTRSEYERELDLKYGQSIVQDLVVEKLIFNEMAKKGIKVDEARITTELDGIKSQFSSEDEFKTLLASERLTVEELQKRITLKLGLDEIVKSDVKEPTDEDAKTYFDQNADSFKDKKFDDVKAEIKTSLASSALTSAGDSWINARLKEYKAQNNLTLPENNKYQILGSANLLARLLGWN